MFKVQYLYTMVSEQSSQIDIRSLTEAELVTQIQELGVSAFRGRQIYSWLWKHGARNFDEMSNIPKALREQLIQIYSINCISEDMSQQSSDGTIKFRYRLHDGHLIESVLIPVEKDNRFTVCVSSQVGCSLTCSFCATGQMKRVRNLDPGEIFDQIFMIDIHCQATYGHPISNIVYMGMGEPLLAYKNVLRSIDLISWKDGMNKSPKRVTVSTAGIAKMIRKLAEDKVKFNLALSLHAADDEKRNEIMPINQQNNLEALMDALVYFHEETKNRISYEYIAFDNFNDSLEDAKKLVHLCKRFPVKVNIIEYNQVSGVVLQKASADRVDMFARHLRSKGIMVTIRRSRGKDIDAACGQLANKD